MVSVRRPGPRGGARGGGGQNKCIAYGKYIVLGSVVVLVLNLFLSGSRDIGRSSSIFEIEQQRKQMLRENKQPDSRLKPPDFTRERLQRREHEEAPEEFPDLHKKPGADLIQKPASHLPPHGEHEHDHEDEDEEEHHKEMMLQQRDDHADGNGHSRVEKKEDKKDLNPVEEDEGHNRLSGDGEDPDPDEDQDKQIGGFKTEKIKYVAPNGDVLEKPEGTGPTKLGYVMDFVYERNHPGFRNDPTTGIEKSKQKHAEKMAEQLSETSIKSCEYMSSDNKQILREKACTDPENHLIVYNAASFPRTWCDTLIPPQSAARMETHCTEPVHLFEMNIAPISGQGMPPIVIHSQVDGTVPDDSLEDVQCSIPCKMEKDMTGIGRYVQGTDWKIFHSYEDGKKELDAGITKYKRDEYYSTTYFKSDIPLSFIDLEKHNLRNHPAADFDSVLDKGSYIVSDGNCKGGGSRRSRWFEVLSEHYHVDALGQCNHNTDLDAGDSLETLEDRLKVMKKYKFNLGFESSNAKDRFTELSYEAMLSGAVPILLGPPNTNSHFPRHSAILTSDFNSWDKLGVYVNAVATNKTLWDSYHTWRKDEKALAEFEKKYEFTKISADCRMCSWAYAKMYGLGWDHSRQQISDTYIPRKACVDDDSGLIVQPFREVWSVASTTFSPKGDGSSCKAMSSSSDKTLGSGDSKVVRSVVQHDSITDITIHEVASSSASDKVTLTFEFKDVNNTEAAFFRNSHTLVSTERGMLMSSATIQDHKSKVTVLANWITSVSSPKQGVIQVVVQCKDTSSIHKDEVRRVRIITEDMGQLHDKMTEYFPSSFSKKMIQDFVDPLEVFYVGS